MFVGVRWDWVPEGCSWVSELGVIMKSGPGWWYSLSDGSARMVGPFAFPSFAARGAFQRRKPHGHEEPNAERAPRTERQQAGRRWEKGQNRAAMKNLDDILSGKHDLMDPKRFRSR